jgi:hypothetical protein
MMEHKAYLFDFDGFSRELQPKLQRALETHDPAALVDFIRHNIKSLKDPYEGQPLADDWESMIETKDEHQFGDFALTKFYDPTEDIGLELLWYDVQNLLADDPAVVVSPILGTTVGPVDNLLDPGKMGAYFQSRWQVSQSKNQVAALVAGMQSPALNEGLRMLVRAEAEGTGLYVTF